MAATVSGSRRRELGLSESDRASPELRVRRKRWRKRSGLLDQGEALDARAEMHEKMCVAHLASLGGWRGGELH